MRKTVFSHVDAKNSKYHRVDWSIPKRTKCWFKLTVIRIIMHIYNKNKIRVAPDSNLVGYPAKTNRIPVQYLTLSRMASLESGSIGQILP